MTQTISIRGVLALLILLPAAATYAALPLAHCRQGDKTESGMQGLTTPEEIAAGKQTAGFNCNTDIVGQYQGEGASWQLAAWKNCAYFDQRLNPAEANRGTVVMDVTDPAHPKPTTWLNDNAMLDPWESLKVNKTRQLLAAAQRPDATQSFAGTGFSIYDISGDCTKPVKKAYIDIPGSFGHTGQWAPDGKTYYITPLRTDLTIVVVDTTDVSNPKPIACAAGSFGCGSNGFFTAPSPTSSPAGSVYGTSRWHDIDFSKDGRTMYASMLATGSNPPVTAAANGLAIIDVSDFQDRKPNPVFRAIGQIRWDDGSVGAQQALPITIKGKPYILFADESGGDLSECQKGKSSAGFPRLIDISDPTKPFTAAKIQLDIHDAANCTVAANTPITSPTSSSPFGFSCHYCNVDDVDDAKIAACSCFASGLRFFDISNVSAIKEIAYLKAPAQGTKVLPGSQYAGRTPSPTFVRNFDWSTAIPSFPKDRGAASGDIWATSQDNGFLVVKLDSNATGGGGGCASVDASLGGLVVFGLVEMLRRRKARRS
jgi:hypothetical protein